MNPTTLNSVHKKAWTDEFGDLSRATFLIKTSQGYNARKVNCSCVYSANYWNQFSLCGIFKQE